MFVSVSFSSSQGPEYGGERIAPCYLLLIAGVIYYFISKVGQISLVGKGLYTTDAHVLCDSSVGGGYFVDTVDPASPGCSIVAHPLSPSAMSPIVTG